ncbi:EGF domain-specific O-linked N-acetylglucosamine transferase-like [Anneissia japonica]|uniref:EGF domain-specific O-linked N-acetylglucosamine transferase-like n=1 Tax=Anneissia japonica TaxID=1529436 RepID=UPI001425A656|nr:EGF domain-specific O-linked N-acetylglucosamine transferase-like [Anneissia japonica]XP_033105510.1 EGF domain-specific O-linked N-acetylglucosamine transferase-like [Anneissia japonica]
MTVYAVTVFLLFIFTCYFCLDDTDIRFLQVQRTKSIFADPDLPISHYPFFFHGETKEADKCRYAPSCPYKKQADKDVCWGYEDDCNRKNIPLYPVCSVLHKLWATDLKNQSDLFWQTSDFGYIKELKKQVEVCQAIEKDGSYMVCSKNLEYCKAHNIIINFTRLLHENGRQTNRFREDMFTDGDIGGLCKINMYEKPALTGVLQSWFNELSRFSSVNFTNNDCDILIEQPSFFMKMDSGINMYHRFCDFVNLYLTQHLASTFSKDINIIRWDTSSLGYRDDFNFMWNAFTNNPVISLDTWKNKTVCLKDAVFTVPSRTVKGFYYNMPVVPGCHGSSFINAFSQHVLHRLRVEHKQVDEIQVTLIERKASHRNIVNQNELVAALTKRPNLHVKVVHLSRNLSLKDQLMLIHSTDILIGIHGAGFTHILFLPQRAVVFEMYNCEDTCYASLSRLRGLYYLTWEDESKLQKHNQVPHPSLKIEHPKYCDYSFEVQEFQRIVKQAEDHILHHRAPRARVEL